MTTATDIAEELLTAYALGELEGEERDRVAAHVAADESARRKVEMLRGTAELLAWEMPAENRSALLPAHRAVIEEHLYGPPPTNWAPVRSARFGRRRLLTFLAAVAASAAIVSGGFWAAIRSLDRTAESAVAYGPPTTGYVVPAADKSLVDAASQPTAPSPITGGFAATTQTDRAFGPYAMNATPVGVYGTPYPGWLPPGWYPAVPLDPAAAAGASPELVSPGAESLAGSTENLFLPVAHRPLSTFPVGVDTASYSDVRWYLAQNMLPPPDAVRIEEMVNAFSYAYAPPAPSDAVPLTGHVEIAGCPWAPTHRLVRVGLKAREAERPAQDALADASEAPADPNAVRPVTVATDVKVQVEFNPAVVAAYRLIGYENHLPMSGDYPDDPKAAGEVVAGQTATALYELIPVGAPDAPPRARPKADELRYQRPPTTPADVRAETLTVKVRYKEPTGPLTRLLEFPLTDRGGSFTQASDDYKFAAAVASYGMILRGSPHKGTSTLAGVTELAQSAMGRDDGGRRAEFLALVQKTRALSGAR
jgi:hypothetical protein